MAKIVVYTAVPCGFCTAAIRYLREIKKQDDIEIIDLTGKYQERMDLAEKTGRRTVPQIYINDVHVGGYDDLRAMDAKGEIDPLLQGKSS